MRLERDVSKWLRTGSAECGAFCVKMHGSAFALAGLPDHHVTSPWWIGWIETKVGSNKPTAIQAARAREILRASGKVVVLRLVGPQALRIETFDGTVLLTLASTTGVEAMLQALGKIT